ncbi:isopentenyl-diphosphate Delta-isomerase [Ferruginibacter sp.]|nr:isopentenyl-diphosphate Delta-isomerase [Ferruginibacter sp.]
MNRLILVDENDVPLGTVEKMEAHEKALLHRAFSVFIFNSKGEMLLQQRAINKYHSGGLWTNACCSHPYSEQDTLAAAGKRLQEEMGFTTTLTRAFEFVYKANFDNGLTEHEYDHVFIGEYDGPVLPDESEVENFCYMGMNALKEAMELHPQKYTAWFKIALPKLENYLASNS